MKLSRSSINSPLKAWALVDEGNPVLETQCLGLTEAMELPAQFYRVSLSRAWHFIPSFFTPNLLAKVQTSPKPLRSPWPLFLICGGRTAVKIGGHLKRNYGAFLVSLAPSLSFSCDKIVVESDRVDQKKRKIMTFGPLHRIQPETLLLARQNHYRKIDHLPKPRIGVFLKENEPLLPLLDHLISLYKKTPFSLMIHCESLTKETQQKIESKLTDIPHFLWNGQGENPYLGFLSHSDAIIISNSSSLKIAEATSTGKPIFIYPVSSINSYVRTLLQKGYAFTLQKDSYLFPHVFLPPLQEAQRVATLLQESYYQAISS